MGSRLASVNKILDPKNLNKVLVPVLLAYSAALYLSISLVATIQSVLLLIVILAVFSQWGGLRGSLSRAPRSLKFLLMLLAVLLLSIVLHWEDYDRPLKAIKSLRYFAFSALLPLVTAGLFRELKREKVLRLLYYCMLFAALSLAVACIVGTLFHFLDWDYIRNMQLTEGRAAGLYSVSTSFACSAILVLTLGLGFFYVHRNEWSTWLLSLWAVICSAGIYFSYTRSAMFAFFVAIYLLLGLSRHSRKLKIVAVLGILSFLAFAGWKGFRGGTSNRYVINLQQNSSDELRRTQYVLSYYMFRDNPFTGVGFRLFEKNDLPYKVKYDLPNRHYFGNAHNNFFEMAATGGILALIFYAAWMFYLLLEIRNLPQPYSIIGQAAWWAFQVAGLFQSNIIDAETLSLLTLSLILFYSWTIYDSGERQKPECV